MKLRADPIKLTLVPALCVGLAGATLAQQSAGLDPAVGWIAGINVATFPTWWIDKRQAKRGGFRVPEWTLHALSFFGGGPAAWLAMTKLRHKTRKRAFKLSTPLLAALAALALGFALMR